MPTASSGALQLVDIGKRFGAATAVDRLSVTVQPGEFFTILGPSGSGKTTTLMMIAGFTHPDEGQIILDGSDITRSPPHQRNIGVVFQNYALFPHMTVQENISFALRMRDRPAREIRQRTEDVLRLVKLEGFEARYPRELSGGQQQRVALARSLVFEPSLLLLDEPLGALDRLLREHMKLELRRIHKELRTTMVYVTHDQDESLILSDRIMILNHGRVEQVGTPQEVYERPSNPFVARFIGESNFLSGKVSGLSGGGAATVSVEGASIQCVGTGNLSVGMNVEIALRPEKIVFMPDESAANGHCISGVVDDRIYGGESVRYSVRVGGASIVSVKQPRRTGIRDPEIGENVTLGWNPRDAVVFASR